MPNQGDGMPCFLYINKGSLSALIASSTHCTQKSFNKSDLLHFKNLSNDTSLYPYLSSSENLFNNNVASGFNAIISPEISLLPKFIWATEPEPGLLQKYNSFFCPVNHSVRYREQSLSQEPPFFALPINYSLNITAFFLASIILDISLFNTTFVYSSFNPDNLS
jgi:hypothetical protein